MRRAWLSSLCMVSVLALPTAAGATETQAGLAALQRAVASPDRPPADVARDAARHPVQELAFLGVKPDDTVVEIWPGGGYWTGILAPLLHDHGTYYLAMGTADGGHAASHFAALPPEMTARMKAEPQIYGRAIFTTLSQGHYDAAPPGSADIVLTFRNLHNWMGQGNAAEMLAGINRALKPGGILGIEEHRGRPDKPQDPKAQSGYVREDYAIALIEKAGFRLEARSEINANPKDTTDWPKGVWTLPPVLAMGQTDRAKYQAIGEADDFVLRFRKVGG